MPKNDSQLATCDVAITPACIQALYQFEPQSPHAKVSPTNSMGIFEDGDFYSQEDLNLFFANFTKYIPAGTHPRPQFVDGAEAPVAVADAGGESDLDFELAYPIIYPQTTTLYQVDDLFYSNNPNNTASGIFNTFFDAIDGSYCTYSAFGEKGNDPNLDPVYPDVSTLSMSMPPFVVLTFHLAQPRWVQRKAPMRRLQAHEHHFNLLRRARAGSTSILPGAPVQRVHEARSSRCLDLCRLW